jgi:hypothetical protein
MRRKPAAGFAAWIGGPDGSQTSCGMQRADGNFQGTGDSIEQNWMALLLAGPFAFLR